MGNNVSTNKTCQNNDLEKVYKLLCASKKRTFVVAQISPAFRVSIGEKMGLRRGEDAVGKVTAALLALGVDAVVDSAIAFDAVTLMKAQMLRERKEKGETTPLYSSECSVWTEFAKENYPKVATGFFPTATTVCAKLLKKYYGELYKDKTIRVIALEIGAGKKTDKGVDVALTPDEIACLFDGADLNVRLMRKATLSAPLGVGSGAGYLFAASGGDVEAIARALSEDKTENAWRKLQYSGIYDKKDARKVTMDLGGKTWNFAVTDTLAAAQAVLADVQNGAKYDYVEVTAREGGQIGIGCDLSEEDGERTRRLRKLGLRYLDFARAARSADVSASVAAVVKAWKALVRSGEAAQMDVIAEIVDDFDFEEMIEEVVEVSQVGEVAEEVVEGSQAEEVAEEVVEVSQTEEIVEEVVEVVEVVEEESQAEEVVEEVVESVEVVEEESQAEEMEEILEETAVSQEELQLEIARVEELLEVAEEELTLAQKLARAAYYRRLSTRERRKLKRLRRNQKKGR